MTNNTVYLDLETTGLERNAEFVSIAIIDDDNNILLDTLSKPVKKQAWKDAQQIHKISPEHVKDALTNEELNQKIIDVCTGKRIVIYNAEFISMFLPVELINEDRIISVDEHYYEFCEYDNNPCDGYYRTLKLKEACKKIGFPLKKPHNAFHDVVATRAVYRVHLRQIETDRKAKDDRYNKMSDDDLQYYADRAIKDIIIDEEIATDSRIENKYKLVNKAIFDFYLKIYKKNYTAKSKIADKFNSNVDNILKEAGIFNLEVITDKKKLRRYIPITAYQEEEEEKKAKNKLYDAVYLSKNKKHVVLLYKIENKKPKIIKNYEYDWWTNVHPDLATKTILKSTYKIPKKNLDKLKEVALVTISRGNYGRRGYNDYKLYNIFDAVDN